MYHSASPVPPHHWGNGDIRSNAPSMRGTPSGYAQHQHQPHHHSQHGQHNQPQWGYYNNNQMPPTPGMSSNMGMGGGASTVGNNNMGGGGGSTMTGMNDYNPYASSSQFNFSQPSGATSAYQRATAGISTRGPSPTPTPASATNATSTGLIRLTLRKPMGIVFEPMTDPHNPSQQRGVRICDLPRTGAAAMSGKLEVGDELLSINDKTMSRLMFDEIMDFIIDADVERVDLLFRRPMKDALAASKKSAAVSPTQARITQNHSNSVKWIDEDNKKPKKDAMEKDKRKPRDDPSVDDTYTVESQSQYTMETYEEYYKNDKRKMRLGNLQKENMRRNFKSEDKHGKRKPDPIESSSFLDMLIDTLCTSVIGRDASGLCNDRSGQLDPSNLKKNQYEDEDEFTIDDGTYQTYEESEHRLRHREEEASLVTEEEGTLVTEDDGTRTLETNDDESLRKIDIRPPPRNAVIEKKEKPPPKKKEVQPPEPEEINEPNEPVNIPKKVERPRISPPPQEPTYDEIAPDPPTKTHSVLQQKPQVEEADESAIASSALPLKELEYDDRIDYAADVSVMESLGGPSLLVERARHENAVNAGTDHAAQTSEQLENQDPELAILVATHGDGFVPDPGLTKEEAAFRDPYKFYEHAVCTLLRENEPEKVRLLHKLMAKYKGRERHLINKLSARYNKEKEQQQVDRAKSAENTKPQGMEKIHEGGEEEEASSSLNDPARANIAAIESVKKRVETEVKEEPENKPLDDGWPPAMADPWGTNQQDEEPQKEPETPMESPNVDDPSHHEEENSISGSSYSGDSVDGTSPAIIAQVSELLNYVYGKTSVAGQIDRVSTIMRAYEGREAVLLELLETKALIKANADSSRDNHDLPISIRNSSALPKSENNDTSTKSNFDGSSIPTSAPARRGTAHPQTPVSALSDPTMAASKSPTSINYPAPVTSPTSVSVPQHDNMNKINSQHPALQLSNSSDEFDNRKKKKSIFGGFFGGKKGKNAPKTSPNKAKSRKKGHPLTHVDDRSI